jgi:glyoxylase-like metal-dependent hydrolase (beta-lactamase superfamily II)
VQTQPANPDEVRHATWALLACPTGSIGTNGHNDAKSVLTDFPLQLESEVYYCGFNSPDSYGGNSYFINHPLGNWLIDSPKFLPHLRKQFHALGGIKYIFLTHQDDVAAADEYASEFGSQRIIHSRDIAAQPDAEIVLEGSADVPFAGDFLVIPTPGHTAGHCVLLYKNKYLFTGDHLDWDRETSELACFRDYCWYSWSEQKKSIAKLADYTFEWILPGHGQRVKLPAGEMKEQIEALSERIKFVD